MERQPLGKGYYINVSKNHTFGTDAVLLSDFASSKKVKSHCDLGSGCGIISMLLIKNGITNRSFGVEISEEAVNLAKATADEFAKESFTPINARTIIGDVRIIITSEIIISIVLFIAAFTALSSGTARVLIIGILPIIST